MARIYIGVGSNIDREAHLRAGWHSLQATFGPLTCSTVYESEALGFAGSPFYNLVIGAETGAPAAARGLYGATSVLLIAFCV